MNAHYVFFCNARYNSHNQFHLFTIKLCLFELKHDLAQHDALSVTTIKHLNSMLKFEEEKQIVSVMNDINTITSSHLHKMELNWTTLVPIDFE